jgi:hypothetical protein
MNSKSPCRWLPLGKPVCQLGVAARRAYSVRGPWQGRKYPLPILTMKITLSDHNDCIILVIPTIHLGQRKVVIVPSDAASDWVELFSLPPSLVSDAISDSCNTADAVAADAAALLRPALKKLYLLSYLYSGKFDPSLLKLYGIQNVVSL